LGELGELGELGALGELGKHGQLGEHGKIIKTFQMTLELIVTRTYHITPTPISDLPPDTTKTHQIPLQPNRSTGMEDSLRGIENEPGIENGAREVAAMKTDRWDYEMRTARDELIGLKITCEKLKKTH
jgi:hypothetical protein